MSAGALRALVMQGCADGKGCIVFFVYRIIQFELFSFVFILTVGKARTFESELLEELRGRLKGLEARIEPKIYEHGFLLK